MFYLGFSTDLHRIVTIQMVTALVSLCWNLSVLQSQIFVMCKLMGTEICCRGMCALNFLLEEKVYLKITWFGFFFP